MKVVLAPDKLKGSLPAARAARALARGLQRACPRLETRELPVADGGEGTLAALVGPGGSTRQETVDDPLGAPRPAAWGVRSDGTGVIETAQAIGLAALLERGAQPAPLLACSRGAGQLIAAARRAGATRLIVGLGGSATVDGGAGLLAALGARLLDDRGRALPPGGAALVGLARIDASGLLDLRAGAGALQVACDVDNPLLGPEGAAAAFGPQKGARPADVRTLERGLSTLAQRLARDLLRDPARAEWLASLPGAGAAGGLGAALAALGGELCRGAELVLDALELDRHLRGAALVVTAEGALDATTARGKGPWAVLGRARRAGVPCLAVAGRIEPAARATLEGPGGFQALIALSELGEEGPPLDEAATRARVEPLLERAGERIAGLARGRGWLEAS